MYFSIPVSFICEPLPWASFLTVVKIEYVFLNFAKLSFARGCIPGSPPAPETNVHLIGLLMKMPMLSWMVMLCVLRALLQGWVARL